MQIIIIENGVVPHDATRHKSAHRLQISFSFFFFAGLVLNFYRSGPKLA